MIHRLRNRQTIPGANWPPRLTVLLAASILILGAMSWLASRSLAMLHEGNSWVLHTAGVRFEVGRMMQLLTDIETAERGYAVSRDGQFLEPYRAALPLALNTLEQSVADNPIERLAVERLRSFADARVAHAQRVVASAAGGDREAARGQIANGEGRQIMDGARGVASQMLTEETRLMGLRSASSMRALRNAQMAQWATGGLAAVLMIVIALSTVRHSTRLRRAEKTLATTLRSVGDAVISTDAVGNVQFMNTVAEGLTGWSDREAHGRPLGDLFRILNEHTRQPVESPVVKVLREGKIVGLANHTVLIARDDHEYPIEDSGAPILDDHKLVGVVLVFRDASAQRADQRALLQSEQRFRAAIDAVQGVLWTNTPDGEMRGEQPGWAALTGQSFEQYQGFGWSDAVHPHDAQPTIDAWLAAVRDRRLFLFEHRVRRNDGEWRLFSIRAIPLLDAHGAISEWVGVHTDVTEQRQTEAALHEADHRKDIFLATLSHELRNPLAPIRNAARLLEKPALSPQDLERSRSIISRQVRHMASLLDDLLDISRITRGVFTLKKEYVILQSLLTEAVETARPLIDSKRHTLTLEYPSHPIGVEADSVRIVQVITNLLTNAAKYTDPEGRITCGARAEAEDIVIYVRDTGVGLAPEMLTKVFDMFSQVQPNQERADGGLGIGLALVKGLVELHGGRIEARSAGLERGSEFLVYLPDFRVATGTIQAGIKIPSEPAAGAARRVLVADDNRDGAESLAMLLESTGCTVLLAYTGTDALAMISEHRPHAAVLDIGMPGKNGYEVAQQVRQESWGAQMTLIAVTGWGQEDDKRRARSAGFDHHLTKPVDLDALEALILPKDLG